MALRKTLAQLRAGTRAYLDEASPGYWTNPVLNGYLNEAKDRVQTEVRKVQEDYWDVIRTSLDGVVTLRTGASYDCGGFRLQPGVISYTGPDDMLELRSVRVITPGNEWVTIVARKQNETDFRAARALPDNSAPARLYMDQVGEAGWLIVPRIDRTLDLELTYVPLIPDLVLDTDLLEMPQACYIAVQEYAAATALMMDGSPNAAAWEARGNASIARFIGASARQSQDPTAVQGYLEEWA